jgi:hypothetical protein
VYIVTELCAGGAVALPAHARTHARRSRAQCTLIDDDGMLAPASLLSLCRAGELLGALLERGVYSERDARTIFKSVRAHTHTHTHVRMRTHACIMLPR